MAGETAGNMQVELQKEDSLLSFFTFETNYSKQGRTTVDSGSPPPWLFPEPAPASFTHSFSLTLTHLLMKAKNKWFSLASGLSHYQPGGL